MGGVLIILLISELLLMCVIQFMPLCVVGISACCQFASVHWLKSVSLVISAATIYNNRYYVGPESILILTLSTTSSGDMGPPPDTKCLCVVWVTVGAPKNPKMWSFFARTQIFLGAAIDR